MRLTAILMLAVLLQVSARSLSQGITLSLKGTSLEKVFKEIKKQSGYLFVYRDDWIRNNSQPVAVHIKNASLPEVLKICESQVPFEYTIVDNVVVIKERRAHDSLWTDPSSLLSALSPVLTITGQVINKETRQPLAAVSVAVKGSGSGTSSDNNGKFALNNVPDKAVIVFSSIGYSSLEVSAKDLSAVIKGDRSKAGSGNVSLSAGGVLVVALLPKNTDLDDVVLVGYGTMRKSDITGTISSIKGKDLEVVPVSNVAEALTGKVAGVRVTTQDGEPGADVDIKVRGGMSITQDNSPLYIVDGFASDLGLRGIDPADVESIEVLKDASTTSIYGARGANGVILVTTKNGKKGRTNIALGSYMGIRQLPRKVEVLNALDYVKLQYEMAQRTGGTTLESFTANYGEWDDFDAMYGERGLDWQDIMFGGNAFYQNHNVSVSGGGDKHNFLFNYSRNDEKGILMNSGNVRDNFRFKFNQELSRKLDLQTNISFYQNNKEGNITSGKTLQNTLLYRPVSNIGYTDEELQDAMDDPINNSLQNPRAAQLSQLRESMDRNLAINGALSYAIIKGLVLKVSGGFTWRNGRNDSFDDENSSASKTRGGPFGSQEYKESYKWQVSNTLSYATKIKVHSLNAMLGNELIFNKSRGLEVENRQFPDDNFGIYDLGLGSLPQKPGSSYSEDGQVSYFGRLFYGYDNRYLVTLSLRTDGSSKFARENRFGYFPSASAAWRIDQEDFMKDVRSVSALKLRLSYGAAGNNRIGNNRYSSIFETGWYANGATEVPALYPKVLGNPNLKWETSVSSNLGLDFGLFNNRVSGTVEVYKNKTRDLLLTSTIPAITGYENQTRNIGSIQNRGVELTLNLVNVRTRAFQWSTDFNISFNKSKVLALNTDRQGDYMLFKSGVGSYMQDFIVEVGQPTGLIYGYVVDGLYGVDDFDAIYDAGTGRYTYTIKPDVLTFSDLTRANVQPGSQRFKNTDDHDDIINPDDRTVIGRTNPLHFGGLNNVFQYKGFDLSLFINWVYGNDILNYQKARLMSTYATNQNQLATLKDRFTFIDAAGNYVSEPEALKALNAQATVHGVKTDGPESNITLTTSDYVEDGSFLRINNLSLGYSFTGNWVKKLAISQLRVYATAYNLKTFTSYSGFDPEVNKVSNGGLTPGVDWAAYPKTRSFVFGINLTFK